MENIDYTNIPQTDNIDLMQDSMQEKENVAVVDYKMVTFSLAGKDYAIDIMQVKEIAAQVGLSSSRITRIVQYSLNQIREYLKAKGVEA